MPTQESFLISIEILLKRCGILSISGPSGTGKTTLAQLIMGYLLTKEMVREDCGIWIQVSEHFSNKRLESLFKNDLVKLHYLKKNVYVIPGNLPCSNFVEQELTLNKLIKKESILPPDVRFIVIDNISHHLRFELSRLTSLKEKSILINGFFDSLLSPLIMKCQREKIYLILIHEISYVPELGRERTFLYKLYDRVRTVNIELLKDLCSTRKTMKITINPDIMKQNLEYELRNSGVLFC